MLIFGKGGHAGVVMNTVNKIHEEDFFQIDDSHQNIPFYFGKPLFIAVGDNAVRERVSKMDFIFDFNICDPCSLVPARVIINCKGSFFGAYSYVGPSSKVGSFSIINTGVILEHDSSVGDFSHLCPGVVTGGRVKIGSRTTIGLGAVIRDGVTIGDNCVIGMGSVVLMDVPNNTTVWGNPARIQNR